MKREHLNFLQSKPTTRDSSRTLSTLQSLGWQPFFAQQISIDEMNETPPVRVVEIHRNGLHVLGDNIDLLIPPGPDATVGDWLLLDQNLPSSSQPLERKSLIKRRAPGHDRSIQPIAANIDTVFIVSSCNKDFNVARIERYIALILEADVTPVIVLTKSDLCDDIDQYVRQCQSISDIVPVLTLDARGEQPILLLEPWCRPGQTVAFLGSSGVGKSTLTNALAGSQSIATQPIRDDDAKGRHTTTSRQLHLLPNGCSVLDTPGMRELQLTEARAGLDELFADIAELATECRFNDCQHLHEPDCAILAALEKGSIDEARLNRWRKLVAEEQHNTATLAQRKSKDKALGKVIRNIQKKNRK